MASSAISDTTGASVDIAAAQAAAVVMAAFACDGETAGLVLRLARLHEYPARTVIIRPGDRFEHVHLLTRGHVRRMAASADARVVVIEDYAAGDLFGEGGLVGAGMSGDEITAVEHSCAGAIATHAFITLMSAHAVIALAVSRRLVARLGEATRRLAEGATLSATGRIHAELLRRARAGGVQGTGQTLSISPPPVLSDLALVVQSTRETVSRTVSALEKRGILRRTPDALVIVAPHRLEEQVW
jgi:CRP-like cAMP-binding protein